jgi:hypothetical protein
MLSRFTFNRVNNEEGKLIRRVNFTVNELESTVGSTQKFWQFIEENYTQTPARAQIVFISLITPDELFRVAASEVQVRLT